MDARKFIEERNRVCDYYMKNDAYNGCADCPVCDFACNVLSDVTPEFIATVEKWSQEHPRKTLQDVFLEQWPETKLFDGMIDIKPCSLAASLRSECPKTFCYDCRREFWMQEVE